MAEVLFVALKIFLAIFATLGITFHLMILKSSENGKRLEQNLATEYGITRKIFPRLEENQMGLQEVLIRSKIYNVLVILFLVSVVILLIQA